MLVINLVARWRLADLRESLRGFAVDGRRERLSSGRRGWLRPRFRGHDLLECGLERGGNLGTADLSGVAHKAVLILGAEIALQLLGVAGLDRLVELRFK